MECMRNARINSSAEGSHKHVWRQIIANERAELQDFCEENSKGRREEAILSDV
jgi:hypothetical protein